MENRLGSMLRASWRITWHSGWLWVLTLLDFLLATPLMLGMALLGLVGLRGELREVAALLPPEILRYIPEIMPVFPGWMNLLLLLAGLVLFFLLYTILYLITAALARLANRSADSFIVSPSALDRTAGLAAPLFTRQALRSAWSVSLASALLQMLVFLPQVLLASLALPPLVEDVIRLLDRLAGVAGSLLWALILLWILSAALEELRPRAAARQAWAVLRTGCSGFLVVYLLSFLAGFLVVCLLAPFIAAAVVGGVLQAWWLAVLCCASGGIVGALFLVFVAVYTLVLYVLVYRQASDQLLRRTQGESNP
jgi:hypothetical protein